MTPQRQGDDDFPAYPPPERASEVVTLRAVVKRQAEVIEQQQMALDNALTVMTMLRRLTEAV